MSIKQLLLTALLFIFMHSNAQNTIKTSPLLQEDKPVLFGGGIIIGGSSNSFQFGVNPELLKSYNKYIDLGIAMNLYYASYNATELSNYKSRNYQLGAGAFVRAWPLEQFFVQIQPEYNRTWSREQNYSTGNSANINFGATSILAGIGYGRHDTHGMSYFSVMLDILDAKQSPYRIGQLRAQPIFRAGVGFPIRRSKRKLQ